MFSKLKNHYNTVYTLDTHLFTRETRTEAIKSLYEAARESDEAEVGWHETVMNPQSKQSDYSTQKIQTEFYKLDS